MPTFGAAIGSTTSTTTFVTAIVPLGADALAVYTYDPTTKAHAGPFDWGIETADGGITISGLGFGSPTSTTSVTSLVLSPVGTTETTMAINGAANSFTFQGMTVPSVEGGSWNGGLTAIDSSNPQTLVLTGYNGAKIGGSSTDAVVAYGVCSTVQASEGPYFPQVVGEPLCEFSMNIGLGAASDYEYLVDGRAWESSADSEFEFLCSDIKAGAHTIAIQATDINGNFVLSAPVSFSIAAPCVSTRTHYCPG